MSDLPPGLGQQAVIAEVVPATPPAKKPRNKKKTSTALAVAGGPITPELSAELENDRARYAGLLAMIQAAPCSTEREAQDLVDTAADAKARLAALEQRRDGILDPLNSAIKEIKRLFSPPIEFLKSAERAIKDKLEGALAAQRQAQAAALAAMAQSGGRVDESTFAVATGQVNIPVPEGSYEVEDWGYEITDATKLPAQFWMPNAELLTATAKQLKPAAAQQIPDAQVPGVRFFSTKRLAIRKATGQ